MRTFPSATIAHGWYQVGWAGDFPAGEAKPLEYFGRELVAYRGESGTLRVMDAYCRHMGAHLGHGGSVEGECIRCPYHGWLWDGSGHNIEIPYGTTGSMPRVRMNQWPVHEVDELVLVYHGPQGSEPEYPPPESFVRFDVETWPVCEETTNIWRDVPMAPQMFAENAIDAAHFKYVHRAGDVGGVAEFSEDPGVFRSKVDLVFGGGIPSTWATPNGPAPGYLLNEMWGLGIGWSRLTAFDDLITLLGVTPVTAERVDLRLTNWVAQKRGDGSEMDIATRDKWVAQQRSQVDADLRVWRTQTYVHRAPLDGSEHASMRAMRQWAQKFYPEEVSGS